LQHGINKQEPKGVAWQVFSNSVVSAIAMDVVVVVLVLVLGLRAGIVEVVFASSSPKQTDRKSSQQMPPI
jgi:hypothetical protein